MSEAEAHPASGEQRIVSRGVRVVVWLGAVVMMVVMPLRGDWVEDASAGLDVTALPSGLAPDAEAPAIDVAGGGGRLTVKILEAPLGDVLRVIAERSGLSVRLRGDLTAPITATFTDLPLDEGIKRLARGHSVALLYGAARPDGTMSLREAWIIENPARPPRSVPLDPQRRAMKLSEVRVLGLRRDAGAAVALGRVVARDEDPVVRAQAAIALGRIPNAATGPALIAALRHDLDSYVRRMAARALGMLRPQDARRALEGASADGDASVRREATRALTGWPPSP